MASQAPPPTDLREHETLNALLERIPRKAQRGLLTQVEITLTCVDANTNYIALGTNVGIVFLYHRPTDNLERLRCESYKEAVTCVQLHEGVDHQVALGTSSGRVYLFLMPGLAQGKLTQLQKFSLDLHSQPVTSVHWSTNGMKLFSGSEAGVVAMTQVEFSEGRCKSEELLKENGPIIQLDYSHRVLLVSTTHRSLICATDNNNNVTQIGQKDRKSTGHYGACFTNGLTKSDTFIYAARPGQRIWKADCNGVVQATFIFKDLLNSAHQEIELLSYELPSAPSLSDYQFQQLVYVGEKELWSWSKQGLCIVDLVTNHVVASQNRMGEIIDLSVTKDDVFVLRQGCQRNLVRLGRSPYQVLVRSASSVLRASPIRRESPLLRAASPVDDRSTKNRSPLQFLQKSIFNKLKKSENELGIPVGEELQSDIPSVEGSGIWGPETETKPHLQKFTTQHAGKSNTLVSPTAQYPATGSRTSIPEVRVQDNDSHSIPVQSVSQLCSDLPPIVTAIPSSSQTTSTPVQSNFSVIEPKKASASDSLSASSSRSQLFENIDSQPSSDDIVFPKPKIKKHKKKGKHKHNSGSNGAESKTDDTDSVASLEFLALQNPVSTVNSTEVQPEPGAIRHHESSVVSVLGKNTPEMSNVISDKSDPVFSKTFQEDSELNKNPIIASTFTAALSLKDSGVAKVSTIACSKESKTQDGATQKDSQNSNSPNSKNSQKYDAVLSKELQDKELKKHIHVSGSSPTSKTETKTEKAKSVANIDNTQNQLSVLNPSQDVCRKADGNIDDKTSETANRQNDSGVFTDSPPSTVKAKGDQITGNIVDISDALAKDQLQKGFAALNIAETDKTEGSEDIYERYSWHNQTDSNSGDVSAKSTEKASESQVDVDQTAVKHIGPVEVKTPMTPEEEKQSLWFADTWAEFPTPGTIQSLSVSASHIWICDKWDSVYYSNLAGPGLNWIKLSVQGKQIAVSPDGNIVWRVHNNKAYAATKVSVGNPEGTKWIEAMKNIACVAVDNTSCWCVKTTGELLVQTDLKRERPTNKGVSVSCPYSLSQISCLNGVVWAITSTGQLVTRAGVSQANPLGTEWLLEDSQPADMVFSKVALGPHQVGWCLDTAYRLWFCSSVSVDYPLGDRKWWQMSTQEYLVTDTSSMDKLLHIAGKLNPQQLLRVVSHHTDSPGVIGTHEGGLWLARHQAKTLQVCRSSMVGNHWADTQVLGMSSSTCWKIVCASNASLTHGSIWSQQRNGELFAFPPDALQFTKVELPRLGKTFTGLSTCQDAAWGITGDGEVYIRAGMGNHCPLGVAWVKQDLRQIGERGIVSVCCGGGTVWAVDSVGGVYQRLGVKAPSSHQLNPAWLPIPSPHITLKRVVTGLSDYMVWGWDQPGHVYVRVGVTDSLPIGTEWVPVPGVEVRELCVGGQAVWAVSPSGELFCRKGITRSNQVGDYWKRVPISQPLSTISVSGDDDVWAIDANGRLLHRETRVLARAPASVRRDRQASTDEGDWELV